MSQICDIVVGSGSDSLFPHKLITKPNTSISLSSPLLTHLQYLDTKNIPRVLFVPSLTISALLLLLVDADLVSNTDFRSFPFKFFATGSDCKFAERSS
jgi:hypothetical protein